MRVLYFDCFAGISGDMTLGALLDLGIDKEEFLAEMAKINVEGFNIEFGRVDKNGINAFDVNVILDHGHHHHDHSHGEHEHKHEEHDHKHGEHDHSHGEHEHKHGHGHCQHHKEKHKHEHNENGHCCHHKQGGHGHGKHKHHAHRNLFDINKIIEDSSISENAKKIATDIFMRVAVAEAKVHGKTLEEVHFHEVGALDSIVDIIGTAICIDMLKVDKIYASVVNDGYGFVMCQHGQIPVPVPATAEIFANSDVVYKQIDIEMELVTPTGAAIIAQLPESYGVAPKMKVVKTGYGAGKRSSKIPNVLRVILGEGLED